MMCGLINARFLIALMVMAGLVAIVLSLGVTLSDQAQAQTQAEASIGIDADPTGNTATLLAARDACVSVSTGDSFQIDVIVEDVNDLLAWEAYLSFDPDHLLIDDRDVEHFLASPADSNAFDISESVPDDDSPYRIGAANITDPPEGVSGSGILARLSLTAMEPGLTVLTLAAIETDVGLIGLTLTDVDGSQIGDSDGDSFFDGLIADAQVAIDGACPGSDSVIAGAALGGGSGLVWWVFAAAAVGSVTVIGLGGAVLIARRHAGAG